jgi:integrase
MRFPERQQAFSARNPPAGYESVIPNPKLRLLEQVREVMRLKHYSIRTERTYCEWLRRFVRFHRMKCREEMLPAEPKIEAFLSELAVKGNVAVSTQNQAFNALLFVYREVLHVQVGNIESVRARRPARVPTVLTPEEAGRIIAAMSGTPQLVVKLLYGSGLRLLEAARHQAGGCAGRHCQAGQFPYVSSQLRHRAVTAGFGHSDDPGAAGAQ